MRIFLIISSKNRPLQLDLCLKSLKNFKAEFSTQVNYACDPEFQNAYKDLIKEHNQISFVPDGASGMYEDIRVACGHNVDYDYVMFLTDDCFFYRESPQFSEEFFNESMVCYSLRLGLNTTQRDFRDERGNLYTVADPLILHEKQRVCRYEGGILYDRTEHRHGGYWNYPISMDGHIFRRSQFHGWIDELCYLQDRYEWTQNLNSLEANMQRFNQLCEPNVGISETSCIVNSPNNKIQNTHKNACGNMYNISEYDMLEQFEQGKRIELEKLDLSNIRCAHTEIDLFRGLV